VRRKFHDLYQAHQSPVAKEALERIAQLYGIEKEIRGRSPDERREVRRASSRPLLDSMHVWLKATMAKLSRKSDVAVAIHYALERWAALMLFSEDGRVEMDNNAAERALRTVALGRKNYLFAGSDAGGERAAAIYSLLGSAKLNGIDPEAYMTAVLRRIADHPINRIGELLPWRLFPATPAEAEPHDHLNRNRVHNRWIVDTIQNERGAAQMTWLTVESKMFTSVAYDADKQILYLRFQSGDVYRYFEFPAAEYQAFLDAESRGRFFLARIRDRFRYERMAKLQAAWSGQDGIGRTLTLKLSKLIKKYSRYEGMIIDDLGYIRQTREEMEVVFTLLAEGYERGSVLFNRDPSNGNSVLIRQLGSRCRSCGNAWPRCTDKSTNSSDENAFFLAL
jgi:hypothetical protein